MKIKILKNVYRSKTGLTVCYDDNYFGVAYLKLYDIPYKNGNRIITDEQLLKLQAVYCENDYVNVSEEIKKFIENN
jgi:hypothetical protein